mmetsp:Transcript_14002/g.36319  ORF Transcript_14002/g.36319 Transcript_14002/m.36319 type:complete len:171 (+) Transcript_14002:248-760(+)
MGAAGQPAPAPTQISSAQLVLGEVASFGGLLFALMAINFGRPFLLNDLLDLSVLNKIGQRAQEVVTSLIASTTSAVAAARAASTPQAPKSKAEQSRLAESSKKCSAVSPDAVRRARMSKLAPQPKTKDKDGDEDDDDDEVEEVLAEDADDDGATVEDAVDNDDDDEDDDE